jgi:hypothetical protein
LRLDDGFLLVQEIGFEGSHDDGKKKDEKKKKKTILTTCTPDSCLKPPVIWRFADMLTVIGEDTNTSRVSFIISD